MPAFLALVPLIIKAVALCTCAGAGCYMCNKVVKAVKGGQKIKQLKYKDRETARQAASEANRKINTEKTNYENKTKNNETKIQELEKKSKEAYKNSKNLNLTEEERISWKNKARAYDDEINGLKQENKDCYNKIKDLDNQFKNNNQVINSVGAGDVDRHWIMELLTLENILICLAIYAVWKIVRDESR